MNLAEMQTTIDQAWEKRAELNFATHGPVRAAVDAALEALDAGDVRVAARVDGKWTVNQWLKKAVLLSFRLNDNKLIEHGPGPSHWWDKVPSKFAGWGEAEFRKAGFRAVPNCIVRKSAFIAPNAILMPSFVNVGAYVGSGTMVDTWVTVGSCAQIGSNCHLSGGVGIGGVLEPLQAELSMGVFIGQSTKIVDRTTGEIFMGRVPAYSVVVPGNLPGKPLPNGNGAPGPSTYCAVIIKRVDEKTRSKTSINELLRA